MSEAAPFSEHLQPDILAFLIHDDENGRIIAGLLELVHFEGDFREIAAPVLDYWRKYRKAPKDHLPNLLDRLLTDPSNPRKAAAFQRLLLQLAELKRRANPDYVIEAVRLHVRWQGLRSFTLGQLQAMEKEASWEGVEAVEKLLRDALHARNDQLSRGMRLDDNLDDFIDYLSKHDREFSTGVGPLDQHLIVPKRGEVMLFVAGKGRGKTLAAGEPILLADGSYIPIEQHRDGDKVVAYNRERRRFAAKPAQLIESGLKQVFTLRLRSGRSCCAAKTHPFLTHAGWKPLSKLKVGDRIAAPVYTPFFGRERSISLQQARILGYLIADGGLTTSVRWSKQEAALVADFSACAASMSCRLSPYKPGQYYVAREHSLSACATGSPREGNQVALMLREHSLFGKKSNAKFVPAAIFRQQKPIVAEFLSALFSGDGSVYKEAKGYAFNYSSTSYQLIRGIDQLLTRFGIVAKIRHRTQQVNGQPYKSWEIVIRDREQLRILHEEIGLLGQKGEKLQALLERPYHGSIKGGKLTNEQLIEAFELVAAGFTYSQAAARFGVSKQALIYHNRAAKNDTARQEGFASDREGLLFFDEIERIDPAGLRPTYDLAVDELHNFVCGNILVHNSWWLVNLGRRAMHQGKKVLHISLEMSAMEVRQRYYQAMWAASRHQLGNDVRTSQLIRDDKGKLLPYDKWSAQQKLQWKQGEKVVSRFDMDNPDLRVELETHLELEGMRADNLLIQRFPNRSLSVEMLESYLSRLETVDGLRPDLLIIDYAKLMKLASNDPKNRRIALSDNMERLRAIAVERNLALVTADQLNREGYKAGQARSSHIGEDWSQVHTADTTITHSATDEEMRRGLCRLYVDHARSEKDKFGMILVQSFDTGQFVREAAMLPSDYFDKMQPKSTDQAQLADSDAYVEDVEEGEVEEDLHGRRSAER